VPDAPGGPEAGAAKSPADNELTAAARVQRTFMKQEESLNWLRRSFVFRGLPFMIDRPLPAIGAATVRLLDRAGGTIYWILLLFALLVTFVVRSFWPSGSTVSVWHWVLNFFQGAAFGSAVLLGLAFLGLIVSVAPSTVLEWSRVGNSMAVMLGFVLLAFFTADSWRAAGVIPWWRLITLIVVFSLFGFLVLYRQASRAVADVLKHPVSTDGVARSIKDPLVKKMVETTPELVDPKIPPHALVNLRFISAILLARRIFISGIIVAAALFLLGIIIIGQQGTLDLMNQNSKSVTVLGFTDTFGMGSYQFFLSESLLKVSLLLGVIAAGYFVFANPVPDKSQDEVVPKFIRKMIILWACECFITNLAGLPEIDVAAQFAASSSTPSNNV
jgi:hypothetical protein